MKKIDGEGMGHLKWLITLVAMVFTGTVVADERVYYCVTEKYGSVSGDHSGEYELVRFTMKVGHVDNPDDKDRILVTLKGIDGFGSNFIGNDPLGELDSFLGSAFHLGPLTQKLRFESGQLALTGIDLLATGTLRVVVALASCEDF